MASFRGVLLSVDSGKKAHKHLRSAITPQLFDAVRPSQFGGLPRKATDFASHQARAHLWKCKAQKRSAAILFFDILSCFDRVIRELLFGSTLTQLELAALFSSLNLPPIDLQEFLEAVGSGVLLEARVHPHLCEMLKEAFVG